MSKKKDLIAENDKLKNEIKTITEQLDKEPTELKKDLEEKEALKKEIAENKILLENAKMKEKEFKAELLGGTSVEKISDDKFKAIKDKLKGIING